MLHTTRGTALRNNIGAKVTDLLNKLPQHYAATI